MVWSKASHLMSRKWVFCRMMCNLLCKLRKTIHEKSRFKALKTWIIYFFECNNLLRIQDGPFNPKYLHFDFWFDTPLEQCALGGFSFMVILNPWVITFKVLIVFCFGHDFVFKSISAPCAMQTMYLCFKIILSFFF